MQMKIIREEMNFIFIKLIENESLDYLIDLLSRDEMQNFRVQIISVIKKNYNSYYKNNFL
jgi:hypothetical protein